ncbi:hypothetical protein [Dethiobacter alkaliphilus]|uniref:YesK-like protein n=1 Tax=Dethiobacter alkaliphilus AHT 1 TaxID=555088 RepID=C0GJ66_DETAL|nr:hypothetical protein [Dethiobacter alkaliphilus]EEG76551.1 conserved hypothetical protein [Dethiobacter alkaliphilus AHT 1]
MDRFLMVVLILGACFAVVTWLLHRFVPRRAIKYLPAGLAVIIAVYNIILARISSGGFDALARGILAVLLFFGACFGLVTAIVLDIRNR